MPFPKRFADDYRLREFLHFVGNKDASQDGLNAQQVKKIRRDILNVNRLRPICAGENGGFGAAG